MQFTWVDWLVLSIFFIITIAIGLSFSRNAGKNLSEFFLGGRKLPWWIAGISMVATTFAADTPLLVAGIVANNGISGNWLWWNMLMGGTLTTFFFAKLWRRSGVLTEPELIELRYSGKRAAFLRGFKAIYLGLFMNVIIIGWVNLAMIKILQGMFGITEWAAWMYVGLAMLLVALYSAVSGLMGVAVTDAIQFAVAMIGCIVLAMIVVNSEQIGGIAKLKSNLPQGSLNFFPTFNTHNGNADTGTILSITTGAFLARAGLQWWSSWYPGAEPGGGGYVAQRMMSCRSEEDAVWATMFFQIAHYALRPWPWIIVGLCACVLYPELAKDQKELGFVFAMRDFLPHGLKGLLLAAFFAAYMSTISTQLNWGAGYLINDFYKRFISPMAKERHLVNASRFATILLMIIGLWVTMQIKTIESAWNFMIECGAGLGLVLILRWYWWRINAWSEIVATAAPFVVYSVARWRGLEFPESFFFTVGFTTLSWLIATFVTKPEPEITLRTFYERVKPTGFWGILSKSGKNNYNHFRLLISWLAATVLVLSVLMLFGKLILQEWKESMLLASLALFSLTLLLRFYQSEQAPTIEE